MQARALTWPWVWTRPGSSGELRPPSTHQQRQCLQREGGDELLSQGSHPGLFLVKFTNLPKTSYSEKGLPASADKTERHPRTAETGWLYHRNDSGVPQRSVVVPFAQLARHLPKLWLLGGPVWLSPCYVRPSLISTRAQWMGPRSGKTGRRWPICPQNLCLGLSGGPACPATPHSPPRGTA